MKYLFKFPLLSLTALALAGMLVLPPSASAQDGGDGSKATNSRRQRQAAKEPANNKSEKAPAQNAAPPAAAPPAAGKPAAAAKRAPAAVRSTKPSGPSLGEYSIVVNSDARLLRVHLAGKPDRQDEKVPLGEELVTEISYTNRDLEPFDFIRVLLSYDSDYLEPLAINDSALAEYLEGDPVAEVDPMLGTVLYEAQLAKPLALSDRPLLSIRWKPLKTVIGSPIEFSSIGDVHTAIARDGEDMLGNPRDPSDGTLSMRVSILPDDVREAEAMLSDPSLFDGGTGKLGGIRYFLKPQEDPIVAGTPFYIDVMMDNRAFSNLDGVSILLSYVPDALTVVDADLDNYITRERNILDGPFHEQFPWSYHIDNIVYQARGMIYYRVGTGDVDMARGKIGPIARIYAVADKPTMGTPITFRFSDQPREHGTEATFNGMDALGDPKVFADGARGLVLTVLPAGVELADNQEAQ